MQRKINLKILSLIIFTSISLVLFSQKPPEKFGKISSEDLKNQICPIDSNAHAYFIFDYGNSYFEYANTKIRSKDAGNRKGFQLHFKRHFRIKILDNQGFSWANIGIRLYRDDDEEKIVKLRAFTYNLENNKVVKTKLEKKDVYNEETSKYWITRKFAMPNVKPGSIIEVEYMVLSDFYFNLREWYFQKTIPVLQSEYHVFIPEYFNFSQTQKGYFPIKKERDTKQKEISISYEQKTRVSVVREQNYTTNTYKYQENVYHYYAKNIPAFTIEEYLRTEENYLSKYEFELYSTKFPNTTMEYFTTSWEKINKNLLNNYNFGKELNKSSHIKSDVETLKKLNLNGLPLLNSAFNFLKNKMAWNSYRNKYVTSSLSKTYKEAKGNCAEINLNLVILLRELGFDAYPVILSTQDNGIIHPAHPSISSFNYVIAMAKIGSDTVLMDATDSHSEINLLPIRCLNDKGMVVNNTGGGWIYLMDYKPYSLVESYKLDVNKDLSINGINQMKLKDYAVYQYKKRIEKHNDISEYKASLEKGIKDCKIHKLEVTDPDTIQEDMKIISEFTQNNYIEQSNDIAFFKPAYHAFVSKNPFKLEEREYPVEFNYPFLVQQIYTISIPDNFTITEIPESINVRTPDGKIKYIYNIQQLGNNITLAIMFSITKTLFLPEEYQTLKNVYQMIINKQNEMIVLKKVE